MGVFYTIVALDDEFVSYFHDRGTPVPSPTAPARNPTPNEIRRVCAAMPKFRSEFNSGPGGWQANIAGATDPDREGYTLLNIDDFSGAEDEPHPIWFEKGWPLLILEIFQQLARDCGPLVVAPDTDEPIIVTADDSLEDLLRVWEHTREWPRSQGGGDWDWLQLRHGQTKKSWLNPRLAD